MNTNMKINAKKRWLILGGLAAGFANGLLGAGGGIIIVWVLEKVIGDAARDGKDVFANALGVMLPVSAVSALNYAMHGSLPPADITRFILPAILGGLLGAFLLDRFDTGTVKVLFSFLVILSGIMMVIGR